MRYRTIKCVLEANLKDCLVSGHPHGRWIDEWTPLLTLAYLSCSVILHYCKRYLLGEVSRFVSWFSGEIAHSLTEFLFYMPTVVF